MSEKETRVGIYADLRNKIDRMDTLSFDDPDRDSKYGLNGKKDFSIPVVHEESMSHSELSDNHIKKNTLSISIDDLIKQNDDYTMALEKKEIDKKYKSVKKKQRGKIDKKTLIITICSIAAFILLVVIILVSLHLGGKI